MSDSSKGISFLVQELGVDVDEYRKILLAEYEEIGRCWRHFDQLKVGVYGLLIPTALAALYISSTNGALRFPIGGPAIVLIWIAFLVSSRLDAGNAIRWDRAAEIERMLGMNHHEKFIRLREGGSRDWCKFPAIRKLLLVFTIIVTIFWALLLFAPRIIGIPAEPVL